MANQGQNFANHARFVPPFHYVAMPILLVNFVWAVRGLFNGITVDASLNVLVAVALIRPTRAGRPWRRTRSRSRSGR